MPANELLFAGITFIHSHQKTMLKKGQKVIARTVRGSLNVAGKVVEIHETLKGKYFEIQPDAKDGKPFRTRASCIEAR